MSAIKIKNLSKSFEDFSLNIKELDIKEGYVTGFIGPNGSGKTTTIKLIMNMLKKDNGTIEILGKEYKECDLYIKDYVTGFIGPNGSGKTTTIKLIMNMLKKDNGTIEILGKEYKECDLYIKEQIGYVGDYSGYLHDAKISIIKKNISRFYKNWDEELYKKYINRFRLNENKTYKELSKGQEELYKKYINRFRLNENKTYKELSKGQRKQFELAMVLSHHPKVIIMDEPTANLDPLVRNEFLEILQERIEVDNASVFYSTHITSDLDKVGDYLVFIYKGKIILEGDKYSILEGHSIVRGKKELLNHETKEVFISVYENSFGFKGLTRNKKEAYETFGEEVVYDKQNLEDILTFYTRGE